MQISAGMVKELRERTGAGMMDCKRALVEVHGDIDAAVDSMRKSGQAKADKKAGRLAAEGLLAIEISTDGKSAALVEVNCETDFVTKEGEFKAFVAVVANQVLLEQPVDVEALGNLPSGPDSGQSIEERRQELVAKIGENLSLRRFTTLRSDDGNIGAYLHGGRIGVLVEVVGGNDAIAKDMAMHVAASHPVAISESDMPADDLKKERDIIQAQVQQSGKPPEIQEKMIVGRFSKYLREVTLLGQPFVKDPDISVEKYLNDADAAVSAFTRFEVGEGMEKKTGNFAEEVLAQAKGL